MAFNVHDNLRTTFLQPVIYAFKIHQGKTVISSMTGRYLYLLDILHVICISLVCHLYVSRLYSFVTRMPLVYIRMSFVCHPYYSYIIRIPLVCTRMSHVCHSNVTYMWCVA